MIFSHSYFSYYWSSWFHHSNFSCVLLPVCALVIRIKAIAGKIACWVSFLCGHMTQGRSGDCGFYRSRYSFRITSLSFHPCKTSEAFLGELPDNDILPPLWPQGWVTAGDWFMCGHLSLWDSSLGASFKEGWEKKVFSLYGISKLRRHVLGLPVIIQHKKKRSFFVT